MTVRNLPALLPVLIPVVVVAVLFMRTRPGREARVHPGRFWIMPLLLAAFIGTGLWFLPRPQPTPLHLAILFAAGLAGFGIGVVRLRGMTLRRDGNALFVSTSRFALFLLIALLVVRQLVRGYVGSNESAVATDAGMVFALTMILTSRALLWQRIRRLVPLPVA